MSDSIAAVEQAAWTGKAMRRAVVDLVLVGLTSRYWKKNRVCSCSLVRPVLKLQGNCFLTPVIGRRAAEGSGLTVTAV